MMFNEKLDLLMNITNTTNSSLAHSISLDASYVSRLRRGTRAPAKNADYLKAMAVYFCKNCRANYQKEAICKVIDIPSKSLVEDNEKFTELIHKWFSEKEKEEENKQSVEKFIEDVTNFRFKKVKPSSAVDDLILSEITLTNGEVFYGIEGKRNLVISFLCNVLKSKNPQTLLLYSNEDLEWLTGNREFTLKWASLLSKVIMKGNKIKIIHTINRNLDEMLAAIKEWLPIYMTGAIEPYYYPKVRDKIFRRTLFIAPNTAAIVANSVENKTKDAANFIYTDKDTIKALVEEYNNYLSLCRPLMHIFTYAHKENYLSTLAEFETEDGHSIIKASDLSNITMPMNVMESILSSTNDNTKKQILSYHKKRISKFENNLKKHKFTEIISLPNIETIQKGSVKVSFSDMLINEHLLYNPKEFKLHLENVVRLMENFENYTIYIQSTSKSSDYIIYTKEDVGVIIAKTSLPSVVFAINESNMTAAFWDYTNSMVNKMSRSKSERKTIIDKISKIIEVL